MRRLGLILALMVGLGACTVVNPVAPDRSGIRSIGVVSALGDEVYLQTVGLTALQNEGKRVAVPGWGIDAEANAALEALLGGSRHLVKVAGAAEELVRERSYFETTIYGGRSLAERVLKTAQPAEPVDAYLVLVKTQHEDEIAWTNQRLDGVGFYRRQLPLVPDKVYPYLVYYVFLIDARSGEVLGSAPGGTPIHTGVSTTKLPFRQVDRALWVEDAAAFGAEQRMRLREVYGMLLDESLAGALQKLGLIR